MDNMELNELRQQMALLKEKIDNQQIVNEQLVRQAINQKVSTISRVRRVKRIYLIASLFLVPPMLTRLVETPMWFAMATAAMLAIAVIYHELIMEHINTEDVNRLSSMEISQKALRIKEQGAQWLWVGIPMLVAWVGTFAWVVLHSEAFDGAAEELLGGLITGVVIGAVLGYAIYRRQQRMIDDLRKSLACDEEHAANLSANKNPSYLWRIAAIFLGLLLVSTIAVALSRHANFWRGAELSVIRPSHVESLPTLSADDYRRLSRELDEGTIELTDSIDSLLKLPIYRDLYGNSCSWYCGGAPDTVVASSALTPMGRINYGATNAHDFNHESVWAEGAKGNGKGEWIEYRFHGDCPRITTVKVLNGYVRTEQQWQENARIHHLKMYYDGKPTLVLELDDSRDLQVFNIGTFGPHDAAAPEWSLRFEIVDVYPGTKYDDAVLSELYFDGIDIH